MSIVAVTIVIAIVPWSPALLSALERLLSRKNSNNVAGATWLANARRIAWYHILKLAGWDSEDTSKGIR
jgi:hypothetical protein